MEVGQQVDPPGRTCVVCGAPSLHGVWDHRGQRVCKLCWEICGPRRPAWRRKGAVPVEEQLEFRWEAGEA